MSETTCLIICWMADTSQGQNYWPKLSLFVCTYTAHHVSQTWFSSNSVWWTPQQRSWVLKTQAVYVKIFKHLIDGTGKCIRSRIISCLALRVSIQPDIQDIIQCFGHYHGTHPQGRPIYPFKYTRIRSSTFAVTISRRGNGTRLGFWAVGVTSGSTCVVNGFNLEINRFNTRLNRNSSDLITGRREVICDFDCR